jgi:hypothetical protein
VVDQLKSLERPRDTQGAGEGDGGTRHAGPDESGSSYRRPTRTAAPAASASAAPPAADVGAEADPFADALDDPFADE